MSDKYAAEQYEEAARYEETGGFDGKCHNKVAMLRQAARTEREREVGVAVTDAEIMAEWFAADGSVHGPNVETVTMPQADYLRFRRSFAAPRAAVPDGWKLVPIEPTKKMLLSHEQLIEFSSGEEGELEISIAYDAYKAMLAAAPEVTK